MQDSCQSASRLRYTQVIKIEAVQSATRELSDQSASSFGHASVSGHFADVRKDVLWASREFGARYKPEPYSFLARDSRTVGPVLLSCKADLPGLSFSVHVCAIQARQSHAAADLFIADLPTS